MRMLFQPSASSSFSVMAATTPAMSAGIVMVFDSVGNLQSMHYRDGVTNLYQYDSLNRLTTLQWARNGGSLGYFSYQLGATGNRTNEMETVNNINRMFAWQYDSLYRLTNETFNLSSNLFYTYDTVGNRLGRTNGAIVVGSLTNQAFAYGTNDWLLRDQYDSDGNTTNSPLGFSQYNAIDQLVTNGSISIVCDGDGNRVSKKVGGLTTYLLNSTRQPIALMVPKNNQRRGGFSAYER
jgi:hypothetical protein